jgi:hypothetical protein
MEELIMGWKKVYSSKKIVRWKNGNKVLEIFPVTIKGKVRWFSSIDTGKKLFSHEIGTKRMALGWAEGYMMRDMK